MSIFSKRSKRYGPDWSAEPIVRVHSNNLLDPPDLYALTNSFVAEAGPGAEVDEVVALQRVYATWHAYADQYLRVLEKNELADALPIIFGRADFQESMLFDFLTMHGPKGMAVHTKLVELFASEKLRDTFVQAMRDGHVRA